MTERGLNHILDCVQAVKEALGDEIGLALDCGPGCMVPDAIRLAQALEPMNVMWCEDMITGDYTPYVLADLYREVTKSTSTPIHTGEQIYLRQNFKDLIEKRAVDVVGPDPCDVGGIAEGLLIQHESAVLIACEQALTSGRSQFVNVPSTRSSLRVLQGGGQASSAPRRPTHLALVTV